MDGTKKGIREDNYGIIRIQRILGNLSFSAERNSYEQDMRVHTGIVTTKVSIGDMVILVSDVNAVVVGGKQFHPDSNLRSEIQLSSAEQPPIEIKEAAPTS